MTSQHLVVDFGGVVSHSPTAASTAGMAAVAGLSPAVFAERYWAHRADYDRGGTAAAYWSAVLGQEVGAGDSVLAALVEQDVASSTSLNTATVDVLREARAAGAHLALLSNAPREIAAAVRAHPTAALFEHLFFSADLGLAKPDPAVFTTVLRLLGRDPAEVTFVDDVPDNTAAAQQVGMATVLFTTADELRRRVLA
jgi:putative hydrolase of the HAD superfamily